MNIIKDIAREATINEEVQREILAGKAEGPCITIRCNTGLLGRERRQTKLELEKLVKQASKLLVEKYGEGYAALESKLKGIAGGLDFNHLSAGLGIYVSPAHSAFVHFPFEVKDSAIVGRAFAIRDLLYKVQVTPAYHIMHISRKSIQLLEASRDRVKEISNDDFPIVYHETHEYSRPVRGTSYNAHTEKSFERDKRGTLEMRQVALMRSADAKLRKYIGETGHLIVVGGVKDISNFLKLSGHSRQVAGTIHGNYHDKMRTLLPRLVWEKMEAYLHDSTEKLLLELKERIGNDSIAIGLSEVWKAAVDNKGSELVVEKDYERVSFMTDGASTMSLKVPAGKYYMTINDTVEQVIRHVRKSGGIVTFVENGQLQGFNHIALKLRYPVAAKETAKQHDKTHAAE